MSKKVLIPLIVLFSVVLIGLIGVVASILNEPQQQVAPKKNEVVEVDDSTDNALGDLEDSTDEPIAKKEEVEQESEEVGKEEDSTWDDLKEKDKIVGKSDKDFASTIEDKPTNVLNDKTGNWRKTSINKGIEIEEYALSYYNTYMKEDEVHHIINFARNTTTWLNHIGGLLYIDIKEHVNREELDASTLGSGMLLKSYVIYPDGDIEEIE